MVDSHIVYLARVAVQVNLHAIVKFSEGIVGTCTAKSLGNVRLPNVLICDDLQFGVEKINPTLEVERR